jgi:putative oxidoreductase
MSNTPLFLQIKAGPLAEFRAAHCIGNAENWQAPHRRNIRCLRANSHRTEITSWKHGAINHRRSPSPPAFTRHLICGASNLQSAVLLALRLTWGWQLAESGLGTPAPHPANHRCLHRLGRAVPGRSTSTSPDPWNCSAERLLMLGLATRLISIPLVFNFIVAYAAASRDTFKEFFAGQHQKGYDDFINDAAFPMLMLALIMLAFGPGKASIDYLLKRTILRSAKSLRGFATVSF